MHGEGVIDLIASDAYAAGFDDIVIVINPDTGPEIEEHVAAALAEGPPRQLRPPDQRCAAPSTRCSAAENSLDRHAALRRLQRRRPLRPRVVLAVSESTSPSSPNNCLVGFELERALVGELPVSRGTCIVVNGHLTEIVERRNVSATLEGYVAEDGLEPTILHPSTTVSMNLWGFPALDHSC